MVTPSTPFLVSPLGKNDNITWYRNHLTNDDARTLDMKFDCEDDGRVFDKLDEDGTKLIALRK